MNDFLNTGIGSTARSMRVVSLKKIEIKTPSGLSDKIAFTMVDDNERTFEISDSFIQDYKTGEPTIKGNWYSTDKKGQLLPNSTLAQIMRFYDVTALKDFEGKQLELRPDPRDFLVIVGCNMDEETEETKELFN
jgi:hypothetical protein